MKNGGVVVGIDQKVRLFITRDYIFYIFLYCSSSKWVVGVSVFVFSWNWANFLLWVCISKECGGFAEQKVKVPSLLCDARVRTVCADVMNLPKHQVRELSPQVL